MKHLTELSLLGYKVKDRVSGMVGVVTTISFDLYGCIQALVHPGIDKDGKCIDLHWFDLARLDVKSKGPVMRQPDFVKESGPERKPVPRRS